ncbi:signal peptidase I [Egibacter rhizosphaerae]|uniref:signal peptidase I n=1 Tax=Egibacter rhizosphaerae TaxID=1670831 RepID=UPI0013F17DA8|nr:signal peptidase I [Egibacter rhizosphaerae]
MSHDDQPAVRRTRAFPGRGVSHVDADQAGVAHGVPSAQATAGAGTLDEPGGASHPQGALADAAGDGAASEPEPSDGGDDGGGRRRGLGSFLAELPILVVVAFVLALLLKTFIAQAFYIPSESMVPTLEVGDRVLVNKLAHEFRDPERGEIVVFTQEDGGPAAPSDGILERLQDTITSGFGVVPEGEKDFIKRIVGMPGETIEMRDGVVYIDGDPLPEDAIDDGGYLSEPDMVDFGPEEVPEGEYFMMGDNRPNSSDSRALLDTISEENLVGRAFVVIWPGSRLSTLEIPDYAADGFLSEPASPSAQGAEGGP